MLQRLFVMTSAVVCFFLFFDCGQRLCERTRALKLSSIPLAAAAFVKGGDDVIVLGNVATLKVYDLASGQHRCNLILQYLTHTVTLRFTKSGKAAIKILGMREGNDTGLRRGARIVMEHRLTVTEAEVEPKFDPDS